MKTCPLCDSGWPLQGRNHVEVGTAKPVSRCQKLIKRGDIDTYKKHLNHQFKGSRFTVNGGPQRGPTKRRYGDYLYAQDREKFIVDMCEWLAEAHNSTATP